jgi:nucleoside-diphosphate-sugar epimerase
MTAPTLVTGATGFIGSYLLPLLVNEGRAVRVLARRPETLAAALRRRVEVVAGDVRDGAAVRRAVEGAGTVLHLAACAKAWVHDRNEYRAVNVEAVETLLEAAATSGVERLVHVSTILTLPPFAPAAVTDGARGPTPYETTKRDGERLVESYAASGRHAVIVHPTRVFGPGPLTDANAVSRAIALYLGGRLRVRLADHGVQANYVYVADVAEGIRQAARGSSGTHYVLGGDNVSFELFLALVSEIAGVRRRTVALPPRLALGAASLAETWGKWGGTAPITPRWIRVFLEDRRADITPAQRDLAYHPRSLYDGLTETIRWLRDAGGKAAA